MAILPIRNFLSSFHFCCCYCCHAIYCSSIFKQRNANRAQTFPFFPLLLLDGFHFFFFLFFYCRCRCPFAMHQYHRSFGRPEPMVIHNYYHHNSSSSSRKFVALSTGGRGSCIVFHIFPANQLAAIEWQSEQQMLF